jgi:hypothetical protein
LTPDPRLPDHLGMDRRRFLLTWVARVMALVSAADLLVGCGGVNPSSAWQAHCSQGNYAPQSLDEWFQASFEVVPGRRGPQVEGYIYNHFSAGVEQMLVGVEQLNPSGQAVGCSMVWVSGTVPPEDRAYFVAAVPDSSAKYRVRVLSFNWMKRTERDRRSALGLAIPPSLLARADQVIE